MLKMILDFLQVIYFETWLYPIQFTPTISLKERIVLMQLIQSHRESHALDRI